MNDWIKALNFIRLIDDDFSYSNEKNFIKLCKKHFNEIPDSLNKKISKNEYSKIIQKINESDTDPRTLIYLMIEISLINLSIHEGILKIIKETASSLNISNKDYDLILEISGLKTVILQKDL